MAIQFAALLKMLPALSDLGAALGVRTGASAAAGKMAGAAEQAAAGAGGAGVGEKLAGGGPVLTGVGPNNARAYTQMLAEGVAEGQEKSRRKEQTEQQPASNSRLSTVLLAAGGAMMANKVLGGIGQQAMAGMQVQNPGQAAAQHFSNLKTITSPFTMPDKKIGAALNEAVVMARLPHVIRDWTKELIESRRHLQRYNASLAVMYARMDYQQRLLDIKTAGATSGSSSALGDKFMALKREMQPLRELGMSIENYLGLYLVGLARSVNWLIQNASPVLRVAMLANRWLEGILGSGQGPSMPYQAFLRDIKAGNWGQQQPPTNQKPGWGGP